VFAPVSLDFRLEAGSIQFIERNYVCILGSLVHVAYVRRLRQY